MADKAVWLRIPLFDEPDVELVLPSGTLSEQNWDQLMRTLEVMRPALVTKPAEAEGATT